MKFEVAAVSSGESMTSLWSEKMTSFVHFLQFCIIKMIYKTTNDAKNFENTFTEMR